MTKFQVVLTGIFLVFIVVGVILFATYKSANNESLPEITVWGTVPAEDFQKFLADLNLNLVTKLSINYVEKKADTFDDQFVGALARGESPDAIIAPSDVLFKEEDKLAVVPYGSYSARQYKNDFIQEAELFLRSDGITALPFSVDPLMMYWNRDLFTNVGIATYPKTWDDYSRLNEKLTVKDSTSNITQSLGALGDFRNINHAKEILSTLIMQGGDPIVTRSQNGLTAVLGLVDNAPTGKVVNFYTDFGNPAKKTYSWNRALPNSKNFFIAGKLATYFGFASEANDIRDKNPNLNFDVAAMPQFAGAPNKITYGNMIGFAIPKLSAHAQTAYTVALTLTSQAAAKSWSSYLYLPPVRRDLLAAGTSDPYLSLFYDSAIISRTWLDRDSTKSSAIFQNMIESIVSGRNEVDAAISNARQSLDVLNQ